MAWAAPRFRSDKSRESGSCEMAASLVVAEAPVKLVIKLYYHEFYLLRIVEIWRRLGGLGARCLSG